MTITKDKPRLETQTVYAYFKDASGRESNCSVTYYNCTPNQLRELLDAAIENASANTNGKAKA